MTTWGRSQIEVMARAAGWGNTSRDISYVAMAESSGNDKTVNPIGAVGLLQILQPTHVKDHPTWTVKWLQDPMNNLKAGLVLYKQAGNKLDGPWLDSRDKGDGGGWGKHVSGSGSSVSPVSDEDKRKKAEDACSLLKGAAYDECVRVHMEDGGGSLNPLQNLNDTAVQISRLAQALAKAGNWMADPANWVRVVYVVGGGILAIAAVNIVARPYINPLARSVRQVIPVKTARDVKRQITGTTTETRHSKE